MKPTLKHLTAAGAFNAETISNLQAALRAAESRAAVLERRLAKAADVLDECAEYFDGKADAEMDTTSPHATLNREGSLLASINAVRGRS